MIVYLTDSGAGPRHVNIQRQRVEDSYELSVKRSPNIRLVSQASDGAYGQVVTIPFIDEDARYEVKPVS